MTDLLVQNNLPPTFVALSQAALDEAMELCEQAHRIVFPVIAEDEAGHAAALKAGNAIYKAVRAMSSKLDDGRLEWGRKILAVKKSLDESVKAALLPLADQSDRLGKRLAAAEEEQAALYRQRVREADEAARAEERRLMAEAEAKRAAEAAPWEEPEVFDGADLVRPVERSFVAPPPKAAVSRRINKVLQVNDMAKIPREINGTSLWLLDEKLVDKLLRAGIKIDGCELVDEMTIAAKR